MNSKQVRLLNKLVSSTRPREGDVTHFVYPRKWLVPEEAGEVVNQFIDAYQWRFHQDIANVKVSQSGEDTYVTVEWR